MSNSKAWYNFGFWVSQDIGDSSTTSNTIWGDNGVTASPFFSILTWTLVLGIALSLVVFFGKSAVMSISHAFLSLFSSVEDKHDRTIDRATAREREASAHYKLLLGTDK